VGGSSRIPLLGQLVQEETGTSPISRGDPGTAVAEGAAEWARSTYIPPTDEPEDPDDGTSTSKSRLARMHDSVRGRRPDLVRAAVAALVGGYAVWKVLIPTTEEKRCPPPSSLGPDRVTCVLSSTDPTPPPPGVGTCTKAGEDGCAEAILAASREVWPDITGRDCVAEESRYGVDLYSAECTSETMSYAVFWRKESGAIIPVLVEQMMQPELNEFRVGNDPRTLGTQLGGSRMTESGERFTCVFEYTDYPVTMILDGPNDDNTVTRCQAAAFLDSADMKSAMADR